MTANTNTNNTTTTTTINDAKAEAANNQQANAEHSQQVAKEAVVLALDFGVKKMGIAIGNTLTQSARPLDIIDMDNGQPDWQQLLTLIDTWQAKYLIVGLPLNMDGSESMLAKRATKFARRLAHRLMEQRWAINVLLHDERLSSYEARAIAWELGLIKDERDPIDDISAVLLLNGYFSNPELVNDVTAYKPS